VATVAVPRDLDVADTILAFQDEHPGVDVHVIHDGARDLVGLVADGQVDFALTPLTRRTTPALRFEPMVSSPLVLICPAGHRFAGASELDLREVVDEPLIDVPRGWWVRELFDRMVEERNLARRVRLEVNEWFGALTMVQRGVGLAYGPLACIDHSVFGDLGVATLAGAPQWELGIASRDEALRGAAGRAFLDAYRRHGSEAVG
jgi:DNA-binding transcriptional LysR family regulator